MKSRRPDLDYTQGELIHRIKALMQAIWVGKIMRGERWRLT